MNRFAPLILLGLLLGGGCSTEPPIAIIDTTDYCVNGGTFRETIELNGVAIGATETTFEIGADKMLIVRTTNQIESDGELQMKTTTVSRYAADGTFAGGNGTVWTAATGETQEYAIPDEAPDGSAAVVLALLRKPLRPDEKMIVTYYDPTTQQEATVTLHRRREPFTVPAGVLATEAVHLQSITAILSCGDIQQRMTILCDARGNIFQTDFDLGESRMIVRRQEDSSS